MNLILLKKLFLKDKTVSGCSTLTLVYYDNAVQRFINYVGDIDVSDLCYPLIQDYIISLQMNDSINSISVQTYTRGLRCFVSWLVKNDYADVSLYIKFKLPKASRPVINVLTEEEQKRLLNCFDLNTVLGLRNYIICSLMFSSGLRRAEVVSLRSDCVFDDYIIVTGKGDKQRFVPIVASLSVLLRRYMDLCGENEYVFLKDDGSPVSATTVKDMFIRLKRLSDIPRLHPHLLRHTFATVYYENGGDIHNLMDILGHTTVNMTEKYMHLSRKTMCRDFVQLNPLSSLFV